jgi:3-oxoacyl-[acyl-carrier-protein] synthase-3
VKHDNVFLAGIGSHLPAVVPIQEAIAAGSYSEADHRKNGVLGVAVAADDETPAEMAARSARKALGNAGITGDELGLVLFGCQWDAQHVAPASYVHQHVGASNSAMAMEVGQGCSGGLAMLGVAAWFLKAHPEGAPVLLATGDRFHAPAWNRYGTGDGYVWGDASSSVVLAANNGWARLLSTTSGSMSEGEEIGRGSAIALGHRGELTAIRQRQEMRLYKRIGPHEIRRRFQDTYRDVVARALADADTTADRAARFLVPNMGLTWRSWALLEPLGIDEDRTAWTEHGRHIGHTGLADQLLALEFLVNRGSLSPGDRAVLASVGVGFTFTAAVVEIN